MANKKIAKPLKQEVDSWEAFRIMDRAEMVLTDILVQGGAVDSSSQHKIAIAETGIRIGTLAAALKILAYKGQI
jgi:hypothetical protein